MGRGECRQKKKVRGGNVASTFRSTTDCTYYAGTRKNVDAAISSLHLLFFRPNFRDEKNCRMTAVPVTPRSNLQTLRQRPGLLTPQATAWLACSRRPYDWPHAVTSADRIHHKRTQRYGEHYTGTFSGGGRCCPRGAPNLWQLTSQ